MGELKASLVFLNIYYIYGLVSVFIGIQEVIFLHKGTHNTYFFYYIKHLNSTIN